MAKWVWQVADRAGRLLKTIIFEWYSISKPYVFAIPVAVVQMRTDLGSSSKYLLAI